MRFLRFLPVVLIGLSLVQFGCQRPISDDEADISPWQMLSDTTQRVIQNVHGTPFELYVATEDEFLRFDDEGRNISRRPLPAPHGRQGIPALSDNVLARVKFSETDEQVLEFSLTREVANTVTFTPDQFADANDNTVLYNVPANHPLGAFDNDNRRFLTVARVFEDNRNHLALLLFDIRQNALFDQFESVDLLARVDLPDQPAQQDRINSIRFVGGNFYVNTLDGAYRMTPDGEAEKIFSDWRIDLFELNGTLFSTAFNPFDLQNSYDDGLTWERANVNAVPRYVQIVNGRILSQERRGGAYFVAEDVETKKQILYPEEVNTDNFYFYGTTYVADRYYFSVDKQLWWTDELLYDD